MAPGVGAVLCRLAGTVACAAGWLAPGPIGSNQRFGVSALVVIFIPGSVPGRAAGSWWVGGVVASMQVARVRTTRVGQLQLHPLPLASRLRPVFSATLCRRRFATYPVVSAATWGAGRLVVLGHQNHVANAQMDSPLGLFIQNRCGSCWRCRALSAEMRWVFSAEMRCPWLLCGCYAAPLLAFAQPEIRQLCSAASCRCSLACSCLPQRGPSLGLPRGGRVLPGSGRVESGRHAFQNCSPSVAVDRECLCLPCLPQYQVGVQAVLR